VQDSFHLKELNQKTASMWMFII